MTDAEASKKVAALCRAGMLGPYWERGEPRSGAAVGTPMSTVSGTRLQLLEAQIRKATSPTEARQFELLRESINGKKA